MKILFITGSLNQGGAEYQILELAKLFRNNSNQVEIFAITDYDFYLPFIRKNELRYSHLYNNQSKIRRVFLTAKKIRSYKPELIISYLKVPSQVALFAKILARSNAKFISGERTSLVHKKDKFHFTLMRGADAVTVNSLGRMLHLKTNYPKLINKIFFFPNIIDISKFNIANEQADTSESVFGYVGRISPEKNVLKLVKAFHLVLKNRSALRLDLYGDARNETYIKSIKEYIENNKLENHIFLKGKTNNISKVYEQLNFLCLLSDYEGFSNVLSEAICAGLPIITSNIPENTYLVENIKNGVTVNQKDVKSIANGIEKMINLPIKDLQQIKLNNRNKAEHIFNKEKIYSDYMNMINKMIL